MTTLDFCKQLFLGYDLKDPRIQKSLNQFFGIIMTAVLAATDERLAEDERQQINAWIDGNQFEKIATFLESKYTPEEWEAVLDQHAMPILLGYRNEVLRGV